MIKNTDCFEPDFVVFVTFHSTTNIFDSRFSRNGKKLLGDFNF